MVRLETSVLLSCVSAYNYIIRPVYYDSDLVKTLNYPIGNLKS